MKNSQSFTRHLDLNLSNKVRTANRSGNLVNAVVVDIFYDKVAIQLGGNGAILRGLKIIGGPVKVGETVQIDFSTDPPLVTAKGKEGLSEDDLERAFKKLATGNGIGNSRFEIMHFSGGGLVDVYSPTSQGFSDALLAVGVGDVILLPDVDITGSFEIPSDITVCGLSSRESIIQGTVTLNNNSTLENLKVVNHVYDDSTATAVVCNATQKPAYIRKCEIHSYSCEMGDANAIETIDNVLLNIEYSLLFADTPSGNAYAVYAAANGVINLVHNRIYADTSWYNTNTSTITEGDNVWADISEINVWCMLPDFQNQFASPPVVTWVNDLQLPRLATITTPYTQSVQGSSGNRFARFGNQIYSGGSGAVVETNHILEDSRSIAIYPGATGEVVFAVADYRKVYACNDYYTSRADGKISVYLLDFMRDTSILVHEFDNEVLVGGTLYKRYGSVDKVQTLHNSFGELFIVFSGAMSIEDDAETNLQLNDPPMGNGHDHSAQIGKYFLVKNYTKDGPWELKDAVLDMPTYFGGYGPGAPYGWAAFATVRSETIGRQNITALGDSKIVIISGTNITFVTGELYVFPNWNISYIYDIDSKTVVVNFVVRDYTGVGNMNSIQAVIPDEATGTVIGLEVYVSAPSGQQIALWQMEPNLGVISLLLNTNPTNGRKVFLVSSKENAYYVIERTTNRFDLIQVIGNATIISNEDSPSTFGTNYGQFIDDDNRFWIFHGDLMGSTLSGHSIVTLSDVLDINGLDTGVVNPTTASFQIYQVGNGFLLSAFQSGYYAFFVREVLP